MKRSQLGGFISKKQSSNKYSLNSMAKEIHMTLKNINRMNPSGAIFFISENKMKAYGYGDIRPEKEELPHLYFKETRASVDPFSIDERKYILYEGKVLEVHDYMIDRILSNEEAEEMYPWLYL